MPVNFEIDVARRRVLTSVTGVVSAAEMSAYQTAMAADAQFSADFDVIVEFRETATFEGTGEDVRLLAQESPFNVRSKRAYVVANDLHFGLSRMAQEYSDMIGGHVELFRDRPSAMAWLDRKKPGS